MARRKVIYQNWIADIGINPAQLKQFDYDIPEDNYNQRIIKAVRTAIGKLSPVEREFIERFYFKGQSYLKISICLNKKIKPIENLHRRAITKLKRLLADFVRDEFGIRRKKISVCPICLSPDRDKIDNQIREKKDNETWKKIISVLKEEYNIEIKTPQILISHKKYHMS